MALESSGTMSIGGSTSGRSINLELGRPATQSSNLNESDLRSLAGVPGSGNEIGIDDFYGASDFIATVENRQGLKIACLEEIALNNNWIKKDQIKNAINFYGKCDYSKYLKSLIN